MEQVKPWMRLSIKPAVKLMLHNLQTYLGTQLT